MAESIFPEIRIVTPKVLCECIGATVRRVLDLGAITEPCLSPYPKHPERLVEDPQGQLEV